MLLMKKGFFPVIRAGKKSATLRFWRRPMVRVDTIHRIPGLGFVRIDSVRIVQPASLTEPDARTDGFATVSELCRHLRTLYPSLPVSSPGAPNGRKLYQIRFTYLGEEPAPATDAS
ncbi:MAG: ASCH domain-containing protein [Phycisphaerae bacterium]|nr:ASCH domain-containing protein [Phycisphaerae bacterium]